MDTTNILFVCGGAFHGIEELIERRTGAHGMGFGAELRTKRQGVGALLKNVTNEDLLKFGLIPEFVGRLPVVATLEELTVGALVSILTEPKNALAKQYQKLMELEGVSLRFTEGMLEAVAKEAIARKSGARGLRSILERVMLDIMYEVPSSEGIAEVVIGDDVVRAGAEPMIVYEAESA